MASETVQPEFMAVMSFNRPLLVPVAHHAFIKAAIAMTAQEIFPDPTLDEVTELRALPFDATSVPFATLDKVGYSWTTMDVIIPDKPPAGVFDCLPEGIRLRLRGDGRGNDLVIMRSYEEDFPIYNAIAENRKVAPGAALEPYPNLSEQEVVSLMLSGLGINAFGREVDNPDGALALLRDLALANPGCERVCMDGRRETWEISSKLGRMASSAALIRIHHDSFKWKRPREVFKFIGTSTLPLELPTAEGTYASSHACTANRKVTYKFNQLYSRDENDITADLEVEFASAGPVPDAARRQYARLFRESGPCKQDSLVSDITKGLANLTMAYRDRNNR